MIHPGCKIDVDISDDDSNKKSQILAFLRSYIANESTKETKLHIALESMLETQESNQKTADNLQKM
jgi:hypothetical protein